MSTPTPRPTGVDVFLPHMRDVTRCEQSLGELNVMWRLIESSARMNCPEEAAPILPTIAATRDGFKALERELVDSLVREKVMTVQAEISTKARYVIDIVVRNLYERTADVGFLAIDEELCRFVAGGGAPAEKIRARLQAYRGKYSVYDEILLLDTRGNVLLQADGADPVEGSRDPLIAETLRAASYVETFRASDLRPGKARALIYSRRMLDPDSGDAVGVLCLCFAFEEEMAGIFSTHRDPLGRSNMLLVDADGVVLAAADPNWIRPGSRVPLGRPGGDALAMYCGRQHLVRTFPAAGYQGYPGPQGWYGQVMIPLDVAFTGAAGGAASPLAGLAPDMASGLLAHAQAFCPPLHEILGAADTIRRVVWNGQVMTAGQGKDAGRLKLILDQIGETGKRSDELFAASIGELYDTALAARLSNAEYVAQLVVDLLDRNLYERANDCRWWALTPLLRHTLAEPERDWESLAQLSSMLDFINSLYTVYTRLFVYDERGVILESSRNEDQPSLAGQRVGARVLEQVLALASEQDYVVTPFEASALYGGRPTWIYHAAVRDPYDARKVVGGIGIVFDCERELAAMLAGALGEQASVSALLVERDGTLVASLDPRRPVGGKLDSHAGRAEALGLARGRGMGRIIVRDGQYTIMGAASSAGYREFRRSDLVALVYDRLGEADPHARAGAGVRGALLAGARGDEFATFHVDGELFAMAAGAIDQALPASLLQPLSMGRRAERAGVLALPDGGGEYLWVFDLRYLVSRVPTRIGADSQVVVVRRDGRAVGLLVGRLDAVVRFAPEQIVATPFGAGNDVKLVPHVIKAGVAGQEMLIQLVDSAYLFARLFEAGEPDAALADAA
jgi:chemotaxis signal transduction protein